MGIWIDKLDEEGLLRAYADWVEVKLEADERPLPFKDWLEMERSLASLTGKHEHQNCEDIKICSVHGSTYALGFLTKCDAYEAMLLNGTPFTNFCDSKPLDSPKEDT